MIVIMPSSSLMSSSSSYRKLFGGWMFRLSALLYLSNIHFVHAFSIFPGKATVSRNSGTKDQFLKNLDDPLGFNAATRERTQLVQSLTRENPTPQPGSKASFASIAPGTWKIVYAPHIHTMGKILLFQGSFDPVYYILRKDGTMTSHARYDFPLLRLRGWLSVSGTYASQDEYTVCRVDFDKAWWKPLTNEEEEDNQDPYDSLEDVPPSWIKDIIQALGSFFFIDTVSVFPVSYLDKDTIVFDFELLGTRICARKVGPLR